MAIILQENIQSPPQADWGAFQTINSSDLSEAIESAQQRYARQGAGAFQAYGPFTTTETTFTALEPASGEPALGEYYSISTARRPDEASEFHVDFNAWGAWVEVGITLVRLTATGSNTTIASDTASNATSTISPLNISFTLTDAQRRFGDSLANDPAPLRYVIQFKMVGTGADEATMNTLHISEKYITSALIP